MQKDMGIKVKIIEELDITIQLSNTHPNLACLFKELKKFPHLKKIRLFIKYNLYGRGKINNDLIKLLSSQDVSSVTLEILTLQNIRIGYEKNEVLAAALKTSKAFPNLQVVILEQRHWMDKNNKISARLTYERTETGGILQKNRPFVLKN